MTKLFTTLLLLKSKLQCSISVYFRLVNTLIIYHLVYFFRLSPNNKELAKQPEAVACSHAAVEAKKAFQHENWPLAKDYLDQALRYAEAAPALLLGTIDMTA